MTLLPKKPLSSSRHIDASISAHKWQGEVGVTQSPVRACLARLLSRKVLAGLVQQAAMALLCCLVFAGALRAAGLERYEYDGLGRVVRVIDGAGQAVEYRYDAAGNITAVVSAGAAAAPTVSRVDPASIRRGSTVAFSLTGTELGNASVSSSTEGLTVSRLSRSTSALSFDLSVSDSTPLGMAALVVATAAGSVSVQIAVRPKLPTAEVSPLPIAVAPGAGVSAYSVVLSNEDDMSHSYSLAITRADLATVSPATVTLAPGQTSAQFTVRGLVGGNTELRLNSSSLSSVVVPIFVTNTPGGLTSARANSVGIELASPETPPTGFGGVVIAPLVGVSFSSGATWLDTQPRFVAQGSAQTLVVSGRGLSADIAAQIVPSEGLTIGNPVLSSDGSQVQWSVAATSTAASGLRRLALTANGKTLLPVALGADQIDVVVPQPEITSVEPVVFAHGSGGMPLVVRGRNLQDATGVELRGGGMTAASTWVVNAEGTELSTRVNVSFIAAPGPRVVVIRSPSGNSSALASPANTVFLADELADLEFIKALPSPVVGVVLGQTTEPVQRVQDAVTSVVGVSVGPILTGLEPASIATGETRELTLTGAHLQAVDSIAFEATTGLTVTAIRAAPDGSRVDVTVSADGSAPLGLRSVLVSAGTQTIDFAPLARPGLLVTPVLPVMESIGPNTARAGDTITLTLRGRNFLNATSVRITPATDLSIGPVTVNTEGTQAQVRVSVGASAATGRRVVSLVAPAGETSTAEGPNNALTIGTSPVTYSDIPASVVGVQLGDPVVVVPPQQLDALTASPLVGVLVVDVDVSPVGTPGTAWALAVGVQLGSNTPPPASVERLNLSMPTGVLFGTGVTNTSPTGLVRGEATEYRVTGQALPPGARLTVQPADCVVFNGEATLTDAGTLLTQQVSAPPAGTDTVCQVRVLDPQGNQVPFADPASARALGRIELVSTPPTVNSIEPILARRGSSGTLLIRGTGLSAVRQVSMEPASGIELSPTLTLNSAGTEISVPFAVRTDAPLGARVVRVINAAGSSTNAASPANTFTVFPEE
ncbi:RHS repeat domain-containing protein [Methyloversatilis sp.]|uniref:RHS repeat domain-containing protein n=1 Tax=Methyloversatilis sp. TaxID=2569862 RepID=UPI002735C9DE|nr:RHS repeat domain-containing protein [Methyloversatilis sp.]MDP3457040.1 RHS repeat domain-containing protein [Methyloversatilis sp.]